MALGQKEKREVIVLACIFGAAVVGLALWGHGPPGQSASAATSSTNASSEGATYHSLVDNQSVSFNYGSVRSFQFTSAHGGDYAYRVDRAIQAYGMYLNLGFFDPRNEALKEGNEGGQGYAIHNNLDQMPYVDSTYLAPGEWYFSMTCTNPNHAPCQIVYSVWGTFWT
jgi:hypothetical protein